MAEVNSNTPGAYWDTSSYPYGWKVDKQKGMFPKIGGNPGYADESIGGMPVNMEGLANLGLSEKIGKQEDGTKKLDGGFWDRLKGIFGGGGGEEEKKEGGLFSNMFGDTDWGKWATLAKGWMDWDTGKAEEEAGKRSLALSTRMQDFDESSYLGQQRRDDELTAIDIGKENINRGLLNEYFGAQGRDTKIDLIPDIVKQRNYRVS